LDEIGLKSALRWYGEGYAQRSGIEVDLDISETLERLSQDMETAIFRIVQEALTNIHKHSKSPIARIRLVLDAEAVTLEIVDRGVGMPALSAHGGLSLVGVGISGMRDRVRQLGGQFRIDSDQGGTVVQATFPLHTAEKAS
jgi:signal transduction histidine kinase